MWDWKNMLKKFSTRADKWLYVFALILHIFIFFAESKILFLYHIDDHQENDFFSLILLNSFILQFSNHFLFLVHFYHILLFFFLFYFSFLFLSVLFFFFFSSFFNSHRSFKSRLSSFFVICSIFKRSKNSLLSFFLILLSFLLSMSRAIESANDVYDVFKNTDIRDNVRNESCEISKMIWSRLNLTRISAIERA